MTDQLTYPVLLASADDETAFDGMHVYQAEELPKEDEVITVELELSDVPIPGPTDLSRARVTRVDPGGKFPVHATAIEH